jgi:pyridoxamine 5'-phosphate oxidase-like protein
MSKTTTTNGARPADAGFHAGELAVQRKAGTLDEAARLSPMLGPAELRGGTAAFLADRTFAVITARDAAGRLWTSPLAGPRGFLEVAGPTTLAVRAQLPHGDPLHGLPAGQKAGLVVVEFAARRRVRVNGDGDRLWWRDYPGNNLFNSFGNLAVDPEAALLFLDFDTGRTLHLSGTAEVEWEAAGRPGHDGHTGRRAVFTLQRLVAGHLLPSRQVARSPYPRVPVLTD